VAHEQRALGDRELQERDLLVPLEVDRDRRGRGKERERRGEIRGICGRQENVEDGAGEKLDRVALADAPRNRFVGGEGRAAGPEGDREVHGNEPELELRARRQAVKRGPIAGGQAEVERSA
jgi:hypothetical protein